MYNSLVLPRFDYYSTTWHDSNNTRIEKLFRLPKRAGRIITGINNDVRSTEVFYNLQWEVSDVSLDDPLQCTIY